MQTKIYFANSVPAALEVARRELGEEALLVNSRPSPPDSRALGRLEVTFAFDAKQLPAAKPAAQPATSIPLSTLSGSRGPGSELQEIRQQIAMLRAEISGGKPLPAPVDFSDFLNAANVALDQPEPFAERLHANGLESTTAKEIAAAAGLRPGNRESALIDELLDRIKVTRFAEMRAGESRKLAFVGPAGRGKTTTLIKIAASYGLAKRVPVRIYSAGEHGIGCQEQMARYAALLGVQFHACESLESLSLTLTGDGWKGLILIDTPGLSPADGREMLAFIISSPACPRLKSILCCEPIHGRLRWRRW